MQTKKDPPPSWRKKLAILTALCIAATAFFGGAYVIYSDKSEGEGKLPASLGKIHTEDGDGLVPFTIPLKPLAPGDSFSRYVSLRNSGNLGVTQLVLTQTNSRTPIITDPQGVTVTVETCDQPWVEGDCDGHHFENLQNAPLDSWKDPLDLRLPRLAPGELWYFKFTTHMPKGAENHLQEEAGWIKYDLRGVFSDPAGTSENLVKEDRSLNLDLTPTTQ